MGSNTYLVESLQGLDEFMQAEGLGQGPATEAHPGVSSSLTLALSMPAVAWSPLSFETRLHQVAGLAQKF